MRADLLVGLGAVVRPARGVVRAVSVSALVLAALSGSPAVRAQDEAPPTETIGPEVLVPADEAAELETPAPEGDDAAEAEPAAEPEAAPATDTAVAAATPSDDPVAQLLSSPVLANEPPPASFNGSYTTSVPIEVPPFHGIEPNLKLIYDSTQGQKAGGLYAGLAGIGWRLTGFPDIVRATRTKGVARLQDGVDTFMLDGQELIACDRLTVALRENTASCAAGGTHFTRTETYQRINFNPTLNVWWVKDTDGTTSTFEPVSQVATQTAAASAPTPMAAAADAGTEGSAPLDGTPEPPPVAETEPDTTAEPGPTLVDQPEEGPADPTLEEVSADPPATEEPWDLESETIPVPDMSQPSETQPLAPEAAPLDLSEGSAVATATRDEDVIARDSFRWVRTKVTDTHGNQVSYSYYCPTLPVCWPSAIGYNGIDIQFRKIASATQTRAVGNGLARLNMRLQGIEISVGGQRQRAYGLTYEKSTTELPRLRSVQQFGRDFVRSSDGSYSSTGAQLAPRVFGYRHIDQQLAFQSKRFEIGGSNGEKQITYADLNGDARQDVITVVEDRRNEGTRDNEEWVRHCRVVAWQSLRVGDQQTLRMTGPLPTEGDDNLCDPGNKDSSNYSFRTGDFNGDGKADIAHVSSQKIVVWLSRWINGALSFSRVAFAIAKIQDCPEGNPDNQSCIDPDRVPGSDVILSDIDGDGKVEFIVTAAYNPDSDFQKKRVYSWSGTGFPGTPYASSIPGNYQVVAAGDLNGNGRDELMVSGPQFQDPDSRLYEHRGGDRFDLDETARSAMPEGWRAVSTTGDFNGDGATDIARISGGDDPLVQVALSYGHEVVVQAQHRFDGKWCSEDCRLFAGDFDGDGRTDLLVSGLRDDPLWGKFASLLLSRGASPLVPIRLELGLIDAVGDFNGDGKMDFVRYDDNGIEISYSPTPGANQAWPQALAPDLLTWTKTPLGLETWISYLPSSGGLFQNINLPFVMQTVSHVKQWDRVGPEALTSFRYRGGLWHAEERRFLGFANVFITRPKSATGWTPGMYYEFAQSLASAGKVRRVRYYSGAAASEATLLREEREGYSERNSVPFRSWNTRSVTELKLSNLRRTALTDRAFDTYGNITRLSERGYFDPNDASAGKDDRFTQTEYNSNRSTYVVGLPASRRLISSSGTKLRATVFLYDGADSHMSAPTKGDLTAERRWLGANAWVTRRFGYDSYGNQTSATQIVGAQTIRTETTYDPDFHLYPTQVVKLLGPTRSDLDHVTKASIDPVCLRPKTTTDVNRQVSTWSYDSLCRPIHVAKPGGDANAWSYENLGDPSQQAVRFYVLPPAGHAELWTRSQFDGFGRVRRIGSSAPDGTPAKFIIVEKEYDARGNLSAETVPYYNGHHSSSNPAPRTRYVVDGLDRVTSKTLPDAQTYRTEYGANGGSESFRWEATYDPGPNSRKISATRYDAFGRVLATEQWGTSSRADTEFTWDAADQLRIIVDPIGAQWRYGYDTLGRRVTVSDPDLGDDTFRGLTYQYDAADRLVRQTDARGAVTTFTYDALSRVTRKRVRLASEPESGGTITDYVYDAGAAGTANKGQLARQVNPVGRLCLDYDVGGRLVKQRWTVWQPGATPVTRATKCTDDDPVPTYTARTEYDGGGWVLGRLYSDGSTIDDVIGQVSGTGSPFTYDGAGRLKSIPDLIRSITYNAAGKPLETKYANDVQANNTYDLQRQWLTNIDVTRDSSKRFSADYDYARRTGLIYTAKLSTNTVNEAWTYTYDGLFRLTNADATDNTRDQAFSYDLAGRMLTGPTASRAYTYPVPPARRPHAPTSVGGQSMTWDEAGNLLQGPGASRTLTWDGENRPATVTKDGVTTRFDYGPDGSRWIKSTPTPANNSCTPNATAIPTRTYSFGPELELKEAPVCTTGLWSVLPVWTKYPHADVKRVGYGSGAATYYLHRDGLNTVRLVTNGAGGVEEWSSYTPYGDRTQTAAAGAKTEETKGFIGEREDPEVGLVYLNARYYDPAIGQFVSPDWWDPSLPGVGTNRYAYSDNNPINNSDPTGHVYGNPDTKQTEQANQAPPGGESGSDKPGTSEKDIQVAQTLGDDQSLIDQDEYTRQWFEKRGLPMPSRRPLLDPKQQDEQLRLDLAVMEMRIKQMQAETPAPASSVVGKRPATGTDINGVPADVGIGPYAGPGVPTGPGRYPTAEQQRLVNQAGQIYGCHTCGSTNPGTKSGNYIGDHQPPTNLNPNGLPQSLQPHCTACSFSQGGRVRQYRRDQ